MDPLATVSEILGPFKFLLVGFVLLAFGVSLIAAIVGKSDGKRDPKEKRLYEYRAKQSIMTASEQGFFNALGMAVGQEFRIFAQVRLSALVDHQVQNGQFWKAALAHVNQKSVDFVLSDKQPLVTRLVIELDDKSHEREDRVGRDAEVERILRDAGIPLLRIQDQGNLESANLADQIRVALGQ